MFGGIEIRVYRAPKPFVFSYLFILMFVVFYFPLHLCCSLLCFPSRFYTSFLPLVLVTSFLPLVLVTRFVLMECTIIYLVLTHVELILSKEDDKVSMDFSMQIKTQMVCKTFKNQNLFYVKQSANSKFISLARKLDSMSDCMEWLYIPLNLVFVSNVY